MSAWRAALIAAFCLSNFTQHAAAQPRGGAGERDRGGILGRVGARRDDRLNRNAPPPPAGAANPNPALNPNLAPNGRALANPNARAQTYPNSSPLGARNTPGAATPAPTPAPVPQAGPAAAGQRNAYYPPASPNTRSALGASPYSVAGSQSLPNPNTVPPAPDVRSASATAPVNKLPYNGSGVLVRLPRSIPGEVNYLVDDSEHLIVHSGEDQLLRAKGSYEVRFSRGVTSEGRSYGEARYTITEGIYRFDVSANGWELYREGEARDVEKAVAEAQKREDDLRRQEELAAAEQRRDSSTSLPPLMAPSDSQTSSKNGKERTEQERKSAPPLPAPVPAAEEETLPAPKSILEPT